jgi:hypothetical protein
VSDQTGDVAVRDAAAALMSREADPKDAKKYASVWKEA